MSEDLGQLPTTCYLKGRKALPNTGVQTIGEADDRLTLLQRRPCWTRTMWLLIGYVIVQFTAMQMMLAHQGYLSYRYGFFAHQCCFCRGLFGFMMGISQLGIGFLGLKIKMHTLA